MQFYACACISATLAQYNPMFACVCLSRFAQCLRNNEGKMCPGGQLQAVWRQVRTASADCKCWLLGCLYSSHRCTGALC